MKFILWEGSCRTESEFDIQFERMGARSWKRDLEFWLDKNGATLLWQEYYRYSRAEDPEAWRMGIFYRCLRLNPGDWGFGRDSFYCDGPHETLSLGPLHLVWSGD